jgi:flagellar biogenesis protein FliO
MAMHPRRSLHILASLCIALAVSPALARSEPENASRPLGVPRSTDTGAVPAAIAPGAGGTIRTAGALAVVLGLIFAGAHVFKRTVARSPSLAAAMGASGRAPAGIIEIIGRYPIGRGTTLVLLRIDRRVLLLSQSAAGAGRGLLRAGGSSLGTLCEITDADEVASLLAKARDEDGESIAAKFQSILRGAGADDVPADEPAAREATPEVVVRTSSWSASRGGAA